MASLPGTTAWAPSACAIIALGVCLTPHAAAVRSRAQTQVVTAAPRSASGSRPECWMSKGDNGPYSSKVEYKHRVLEVNLLSPRIRQSQDAH